jgi:putative ABC transport system permease protein
VKTIDRKLIRDLFLMKSQVVTIGLVVACGIAAFVASLSTYHSLTWSQNSYYKEGHFANIFASLKVAPEGVIKSVTNIPGVAEAESRLVYNVTLDIPGVTEPVVGRVISIPDGGQPNLNKLYLRKGRYIEPGRYNEILVSERFAAANGFKPGDNIVAILNGKREALQIVGMVLSPEYIYVVAGGIPIPDDKHFGILWMNRSGVASAFNMVGAFNDLVLTVGPGFSADPIIESLDHTLEPYGGLGAYDRKEQLSNRLITQEIQQQRAMAITIPTIFLGVAAFLINVVIGRLVSTQREQIAVLKALGYKNRTIGIHYLKMSAVIVLGGSALGLLIGIWLGEKMTELYSAFFSFPLKIYRLEPWLPLLAIGISGMAMISGVLNAVYHVLILPPAEAMRPPAPPSYRRTIIEKVGIFNLLAPEFRMIIRNIVRRPFRAVLSSLGVALAVGILITGTFMYDAIDYMINSQFLSSERGDATIGFTQPVSFRARNELEHIPGVLFAEKQRTVPVKILAGHRSYRTAILGLPKNGELKRPLDQNLHPIPIPPEGILLTDRLGEILGVQNGDRITIQALEGSRVTRDVVVVSLVNDLLGLSAYMDLDALNRLMGEGDSVTSVAVRMERSFSDLFYVRVKELPKVSTVNLKEAVVRSFNDTTGKYIDVFIGILTGFAVIIAIGIVYNNARIALSERIWELASLRVLGFSRREVSTLLLGELTLELLVGIPIGFAIGYLFASASISLTDTELFRLPLIIEFKTYAYAAISVLVSGIVAAMIVRHRIDHLDLVGVLKTRE